MLNSFKVVNALHSYFSETTYHNSDKDVSLRTMVEDTMKEIGLISTKVKFTQSPQPLTDSKPVEEIKVSSENDNGALQKLQKKIT
jgi:hypothetical protein